MCIQWLCRVSFLLKWFYYICSLKKRELETHKEKQPERCNLCPIDIQPLGPLLGAPYHLFLSALLSSSLSNTFSLYFSLLISIQLGWRNCWPLVNCFGALCWEVARTQITSWDHQHHQLSQHHICPLGRLHTEFLALTSITVWKLKFNSYNFAYSALDNDRHNIRTF